MAGGRIRIGHLGPGQYQLSAEYGQFNLNGQTAALNFGPVGGAPTAEGVDGTIGEDANVTINTLSGQNFQAATTSTVLYDDFRGQSNGANASTTAVVGTWQSMSTAGDVSSVQGGYAGRSYWHPSTGTMRFDFTPSTGFRGSFKLFSPAASDAQIEGGQSKTAWVMDTANGYADPAFLDMAFPTKMGNSASTWGVAGNDYNLQTNIGPHLPAGEWVYFEFSFAPSTGWRFTSCSATFGLQIDEGAQNVYTVDAAVNSTTVDNWDLGSTTFHDYYYTEIHCHTGSGANAKVHITDAENYLDSSVIYDCDINSWTSSEIDVTLRCPQAFLESGSAHIHVIRPDRTHFNSNIGRQIS
jgi:hypothetical protein